MRHGAFVSLTITRATLERDLSRDCVHPDEQLIEVRLSPNQWAELVSSFGIGEGVPCTISRLGGEAMPPVPEEGLRDTFEGEVKEQIAGLVAKVTEFRRMVGELLEKPRLNKPDKDALRGLAAAIEMEIGSNVPFLQAQFEEAMDKATTVAKSEITAHVENLARMVGVEGLPAALASSAPPPSLMLEGPPRPPDESGS